MHDLRGSSKPLTVACQRYRCLPSIPFNASVIRSALAERLFRLRKSGGDAQESQLMPKQRQASQAKKIFYRVDGSPKKTNRQACTLQLQRPL